MTDNKAFSVEDEKPKDLKTDSAVPDETEDEGDLGMRMCDTSGFSILTFCLIWFTFRQEEAPWSDPTPQPVWVPCSHQPK